MSEHRKIPTSKVERASRLIKAGGAISLNYVKHYTKKAFQLTSDSSALHQQNATTLFEALGELKGSALKVAQLLSLDTSVLPAEYANQLMRAQHKAPPLSYPLIVKIFRKELGKTPDKIFDSFDRQTTYAASIGQVHRATLQGKQLAVKIQYPGVAESVTSDLKMLKPLALRILKVNAEEAEEFFREVETKLLEETDYENEMRQSQEMARQCAGLAGLEFPAYFPEFSSRKVLTMSWLEGMHLDEYLHTNPSQEERNYYGQLIWDFYDYQAHVLRTFHADPHPGNFLFMADNKLGVLDFGCVKKLPDENYRSLAALFDRHLLNDPQRVEQLLYDLRILLPDDSPPERDFYRSLFYKGYKLLGKPVLNDVFDFGDTAYMEEVFREGRQLSQMKELRNSKSVRGTPHAIYVNRTYFGLYMLLHKLGAKIRTRSAYL
ncbi:MAG: ABC transporter [Chitinophagales bacterium]|nr:MAG: ABC transporter [Chitinophagales bacterium]